jgi:hypothetical protein
LKIVGQEHPQVVAAGLLQVMQWVILTVNTQLNKLFTPDLIKKKSDHVTLVTSASNGSTYATIDPVISHCGHSKGKSRHKPIPSFCRNAKSFANMLLRGPWS